MSGWKCILVSNLFAMIVLVAGCDNKPTSDAKQDGKDGKTKKDAGHPEVGPHAGAIAEWGEEDEYHVEFTVNHENKEATVYILDHSVKKTKPIEAEEITLTLKLMPPVTLKLKAWPQKNDPGGTSSRFTGKHEALAKEMDFEGTISGTVNGLKYTGDFKEKDGEGHGHKH